MLCPPSARGEAADGVARQTLAGGAGVGAAGPLDSAPVILVAWGREGGRDQFCPLRRSQPRAWRPSLHAAAELCAAPDALHPQV